MADGREFHAPVVISDAGALNTFGRLLPSGAGISEKLVTSVKEIGSSMSYFCLYVGLDRTSEELGLNGTNLWIFPGPDHDANVARFSADPDAEFPVLFMSFPSAKDPEFTTRHPGHSTIEVITLAPYRWFESWENTRWKRRGADYDALKQRFTMRLRDELERHVPSVRGHIKLAELSTPLSVRHFANYPAGEAYGLSSTPARFRLRELGARTPVPGLFLAGQDVAMLGVTGAMFGGAIAASAILGRNLIAKATKPYRGDRAA
jgi:all-trans-retinol 13,14-reductase